MNYTKYKITKELSWADNLGRWIITYKSDVYPLQAQYLLPDTVVYNYEETPEVGSATTQVLDLNFWFACFQYEQQLKNTPVAPPSGQVPQVEGPVNA
jgi:hypothetical protein